MPQVAERINTHQWLPSERFHLLFLSEGFTTSERFYARVSGIAKHLLELDPWSRGRVGIWARYDASSRRYDPSVHEAAAASAKVDKATAFRFYGTGGAHAWSAKPETIIDALLKTCVTLKTSARKKVVVPAENIFLRKPLPDFGAVCVLIDADDEIRVTYGRDNGAIAAIASPPLREAFQGLAPLLVMSIGWPEAPNLSNEDQANSARLAHELGHVFDLADEYESDFTIDPCSGSEGDYGDYGDGRPDRAQEPDAPNLTAEATLWTQGALDPQKVKWRRLVPAERRGKITDTPHPDPGLPLQVAEAANRAKDSLLFLRHPSRTEWGSGLRNLSYFAPAFQPLEQAPEPNLIEGGGYYRRGILRPALECTMRFSTFDPAGDNACRAVAGYCPVCLRHLAERLTGTLDFDPAAARVFQGDPSSRGVKVSSRLAAAFAELVRKHPELALRHPNDPVDPDELCSCVETTVRRYETFLHTVVKWKRAQSVPLSDWYAKSIQFPFLRSVLSNGSEQGGWNAWHIWMSAQNPLRLRGLTAFAGLGAAGALVYAGLGSLANERVGDPDVGWIVEGLTPDALDNVAPGSLLQLWNGKTEYVNLVRYVAGLDPFVATPPPRDGHSVVYMGRNRANEHIVADQAGTAESLSQWCSGGYDFIIAAQWFDGWWPGAPERP